MAHSQNLGAEGVELQLQFDFLRERGCDVIQGYLISRPIPPENMLEFIDSRNSMVNAATSRATKTKAKAG